MEDLKIRLQRDVVCSPIRNRSQEIPQMNVAEYLLKNSQLLVDCDFGSRPWLIDSESGHEISFQEVQPLTVRLSQHLREEYGLNDSNVVGFYGTHSVLIPILVLAAWLCNTPISLFHPKLSEEDIRENVKAARVDIFITDDPFYDKLDKLQLADVKILRITDLIQNLNQEFDNYGPENDDPVSSRPEDIIFVPFSSGTAAPQKAVAHTHRNLITLFHYGFLHPVCSEKCTTMANRLYHPFEFLNYLYGLISGETLVIAPLDQNKFLKAVETYRPCVVVCKAGDVISLAKSANMKSYDMSSVQTLVISGSTVQRAAYETIKDAFPISHNILQLYWTTELLLVASTEVDRQLHQARGWIDPLIMLHEKYYSSVGRLLPYVEGKVVDPKTNQQLPAKIKGELCFRSETMMKGYLSKPREFDSGLDEDGWFHTGDIGYFDEEGCLYVKDKVADSFKYRGFLVSPLEIENVLLEHPEVRDAAVIGVPDQDHGAASKAYVVTQDESHISEKDVVEFVDGRADVPLRLHAGASFINYIPRNFEGRILKRILKKNPE